MFNIRIEREHDLVDVELGGMLTVDEVGQYIAALQKAFIANHLRSYAMIIDVRNCPIQSQDVIRVMGEHMVHMPKAHAIAVVTGSSLAKMQVRRLFSQPYARITATVSEARAWVLRRAEPLAA